MGPVKSFARTLHFDDKWDHSPFYHSDVSELLGAKKVGFL